MRLNKCMETKDDIYYVKQVLDGKTDMFGCLISSYSNMVYSLVTQIVGRTEETDEIVQDVFINAYRNLQKFNGKSKFSTWLYRIAYNSSVSATRKRKYIFVDESRLNSVSDDAVDFSDDDDFNGDRIERLTKVIEMLNTEEKALISLFYYNDKSIDDISEIMNISVANVKVKLHRVRKKMYVLINDFGDGKQR